MSYPSYLTYYLICSYASTVFSHVGAQMTITPIRVQFKTTCQILDMSREALRHKIRTDATFPRPIKTGDTKQAPVYFDYAELVEWHNSKKEAAAQVGV